MTNFYPEHNFYSENSYVKGFENNRYLPDDVKNEYLQIIKDRLPQTSFRILDVGGGNGRFSIPLAYQWPNYEISCIDISSEMISSLIKGMNSHQVNNLIPICEDFLKFKTKFDYDLLLFSESLHLFPDKELCLNFAAKLLVKGGIIIIRSPLSDSLLTGDMYQNFPEALEIDKQRHMSMENIELFAEAINYQVSEIFTIKESILLQTNEYLNIFEEKIYSTLRLIPEQIYNERLAQLRNRILGLKEINHSIDMSVIILCQNF